MKLKAISLSLSFTLGLLGAMPVWAQTEGGTPVALDLLQAYREAVANDAVLASARAQLQANRERLPQGRAGLLPTIGLTGLLNWADQSSETIRNIGSGTVHSNPSQRNFGLQLSQPLFRYANLQAYEQAKLLVTQAEAQYAAIAQDLILRVSQAYFDILVAQDAVTVVAIKKAAIAEQLAQAKRNFEVGTATITDTNEAQARFDLAVAEEIGAENDLAVKRTALRQIIGRAPGMLRTLKAGVTLDPPQPNQIDPWVDQAENSNFAVAAQKVGVEIADREIERRRAGHYPTLDLVASAARNQTANSVFGIPPAVASIDRSTITQGAIGLQLNVPLYAGGLVQSQVREGLALRDKSLSDLENTRRTAAQNSRQAYSGVLAGLAGVRALEAAERSSQVALESNKLGYQVGVRINIDVLNAQQQLSTTQRDLSKARYDTLLNGLRLKAAAGALKEEDLTALNTLLAAPGEPTAISPPAPRQTPVPGTGSTRPPAPGMQLKPDTTPPQTPGSRRDGRRGPST